MKRILVLTMLITINYCFCQMKPSKLSFKSGKIVNVKGKIKGKYFKYRLSDKDKPVKVSFSEIEYVKINVSSDETKTYKYFKVKDSEKYKVLEEIKKGKVSLYTTSTNGYSNPYGAGMSRQAYTVKNYYLRREGNNEVVHIGSNQLFSKSFKEGASIFFKDCQELVNKIQNKELRKRDIVAIVKYYNQACNK